MAKDQELTDAVTRALVRMERGADGYKDKLPPKLIAAIQDAPLVDEESLGPILPISPIRLSVRECEVVLFLSHGASYSRTAKELDISVETVKSHIKQAKQKLGAKTTSHLIRLALEGDQIE